MKKIIYFFSLFLFCFVSCSNDDNEVDDTNIKPIDKNEVGYYYNDVPNFSSDCPWFGSQPETLVADLSVSLYQTKEISVAGDYLLFSGAIAPTSASIIISNNNKAYITFKKAGVYQLSVAAYNMYIYGPKSITCYSPLTNYEYTFRVSNVPSPYD